MKTRRCAVFFQAQPRYENQKTDAIQSKSHQKWKSNTCATVKDKKSIKNLVVKKKKREGGRFYPKGVWGLRNTCCTNVSNEIHLPPHQLHVCQTI